MPKRTRVNDDFVTGFGYYIPYDRLNELADSLMKEGVRERVTDVSVKAEIGPFTYNKKGGNEELSTLFEIIKWFKPPSYGEFHYATLHHIDKKGRETNEFLIRIMGGRWLDDEHRPQIRDLAEIKYRITPTGY